MIIVACQVSLSCSSIINALYLVLFDRINNVPDVTIVRILQITSITSSIFYFSAQALYKVRNHYHLFFTLITFENLQFLHNEYVMGKFNLLLYLGGKEVEFLVVMFFAVFLGGGQG